MGYGDEELSAELPTVKPTMIPGRISRRLDRLGKCVMFAAEACLKVLPEDSQPAIISTSRHGDLPFMSALIQNVRAGEDVSPTAFAYSVHNRFSSLVSMPFGFKGVNGAYSSYEDGFPLALAEAVCLLEEEPTRPVLILAYEPEIPTEYQSLIKQRFKPHAGAFLLVSENHGDDGAVCCALGRHFPSTSQPSCERPPGQSAGNHGQGNNGNEIWYRGSCLPFIETLTTGESVAQGCWEYSRVSG